MGAHKLDIEFEDDDEVKAREVESAKKKAAEDKHAADMGELEFDVDDGDDDEVAAPTAAPAAAPAGAPAQKPAAQQQQQQQQQQAAPAQQARPQAQAPQGGGQPANVSTSPYMHASPGAANYNLGDELRGAIGGNRILEIELQAKVEIAVTHRLTTIIAENAQENKVLENKVNKILAQVAAKVPALKKELTMIKRLLAEHAAVDKEKFRADVEASAKSKAVAPVGKPAPAKKKAS